MYLGVWSSSFFLLPVQEPKVPHCDTQAITVHRAEHCSPQTFLQDESWVLGAQFPVYGSWGPAQLLDTLKVVWGAFISDTVDLGVRTPFPQEPATFGLLQSLKNPTSGPAGSPIPLLRGSLGVSYFQFTSHLCVPLI